MNALFDKIVSLSKRRGFLFQSSEVYGGLAATYDYGPLGVELKRNVAQSWWRHMVYENDNVVGLDAAILMHPKVWKASGHVDAFNDPLIDDKTSDRFPESHTLARSLNHLPPHSPFREFRAQLGGCSDHQATR